MDVSIAEALAGKAGEGAQVTIKGWVRTRRDSKAGFSFVAVNDGSCFDSIQVVAANTLPNYQSEIMRLTTGCAVVVTGQLVQSQGEGQSREVQAESVEVVGRVEGRADYPASAKH